MAENCYTGITQAITNACADAVKAGVEEDIYVLNREDIASITRSGSPTNLVTAITMKSTKRAWKITGTKMSNNLGYDIVIRDNAPDAYTHIYEADISKNTALIRKQLDNLGDVVVIAENRNKASADGTFIIYGYESGLYPSAGSQRSNDNYNQHTLTLQTREGQEESERPLVFLSTDYATTLAALVALETPAT